MKTAAIYARVFQRLSWRSLSSRAGRRRGSARHAVDATSPVATPMVHEIASRFGTAVSERVAASALPFIGALSGATVNLMFMKPFSADRRGAFYCQASRNAATAAQRYEICIDRLRLSPRIV